MPKGTKVEKVYTALKKKGKDEGSAARIAQALTGLSLKTGKPPKKKKSSKKGLFPKRKVSLNDQT